MTRTLAALAAIAVATPTLAQPVIVADSGDSAWVLAASLLVLLGATAGLAFGAARERVARLMLSTAVAVLVMAVIGYSLAFGEGTVLLGGAGNALLANLADLRAEATIPESLYAFYEMSVAILALNLLVGGIGARARGAWLWPFAVLWMLIVYVPLARWMWGGGWLAALGAQDFAGGMVVFTSVGVTALTIALLRGDRSDSVVDEAMGMSGFAWVGVLGLIGGAALGAGDDAAGALLNALLATATAVIVASTLRRVAASPVAALSGLAAISAGAVFVGPLGALAIGALGGASHVAAARLTMNLRVADGAAAFATWGAAAVSGAIFYPLFILPALGGPGFEDGTGLVTIWAAQSIATLAVVLWSAVAATIAALAVSIVAPMREDGGPAA